VLPQQREQARKHAAGPPGAHSRAGAKAAAGRELFSEGPASRQRRYGLPGSSVNRFARTAVDNPGDNLGRVRRVLVDILDRPVDNPVDRCSAARLTSGAKES